MKFLKTKAMKALTLVCAAALAASLAAAPAFAAPVETTDGKASYEGTTYTVTVYGGNQGTVNGQDKVVFTDIEPGETFDFSQIKVELPENSKYYAKLVRLAALDNVRSDNIRGEQVQSTVAYAAARTDGTLENLAPVVITEDTDFVVGYGIQANRVQYTVTYSDAAGNEIAPSKTFFGDIGEVPATAAAYVEGYVPRADVLTKTLTNNEAENVFPFVYDRLAEGFTTEENDNGGVDIVGPDGSRVDDAYTTTTVRPSQDDQTTVSEAEAPATEVETAGPADTTVSTDEAAESAGAGTPLVTDNGTEVIGEDGTPLAAPVEENLDDEATPLAAGQQPGVEQGADTAWIPWAVAAAVLVALMMFIIVRGRKQQKDAEAAQA